MAKKSSTGNNRQAKRSSILQTLLHLQCVMNLSIHVFQPETQVEQEEKDWKENSADPNQNLAGSFPLVVLFNLWFQKMDAHTHDEGCTHREKTSEAPDINGLHIGNIWNWHVHDCAQSYNAEDYCKFQSHLQRHETTFLQTFTQYDNENFANFVTFVTSVPHLWSCLYLCPEHRPGQRDQHSSGHKHLQNDHTWIYRSPFPQPFACVFDEKQTPGLPSVSMPPGSSWGVISAPVSGMFLLHNDHLRWTMLCSPN